jgi:hypothetical protein
MASAWQLVNDHVVLAYRRAALSAVQIYPQVVDEIRCE